MNDDQASSEALTADGSPQFFAGAAIRGKLAEIESRLARQK